MPSFFRQTLWSKAHTKIPSLILAATLFVVGLLAILQGKNVANFRLQGLGVSWGAPLLVLGVLSAFYIYYAKKCSETFNEEVIRETINKNILFSLAGAEKIPTWQEVRALHCTIVVRVGHEVKIERNWHLAAPEATSIMEPLHRLVIPPGVKALSYDIFIVDPV